MAELIREHSFVNNVCRWCGGTYSPSLTGEQTFTCVVRDGGHIIRSHPPSIFESAEGFDAIHARIVELEAEKKAWLATAPLGTEDGVTVLRSHGEVGDLPSQPQRVIRG